MKKILPELILALSLQAFFPVYAQEAQEMQEMQDLQSLDSDFRIDYEGEILGNGSLNEKGDKVLNLKRSYISLNAKWKSKIKLVLAAKLESLFKENGVEFNDHFSIEEFIQDAYIEIKDIGAPVAIIVGKQPISFSQNVQAMPLFFNNPLASLQEIKEVYGFTVDFTEGVFGIFDQVELSAFETEGGDLSLGTIDGLSIRLSKMLTDNIVLTLGHAELGNSHLESGKEARHTLGLIGESDDGILVGWVEGMYFSNNPTYPKSSFAITAGAMGRVQRTTDVVIEFNYVQKELRQYALGTRTALTKALSLGLEVRYTDYVKKDNEIVFGASLAYGFGSNEFKPNEQYLFDGKGEENSDEEYSDDDDSE